MVALARAKVFNVAPDAHVVRQLNLAEIRCVCCVISVCFIFFWTAKHYLFVTSYQ